jgi:hypothetical protein
MNSNKQNKRPIELEIIEEQIIIEEKDYYDEVRRDFKSKQSIPSNSIPTIMTHSFKSSTQLLQINPYHSVYKIMLKDLLVDSVENWEFNRPPDMERIPIIAEDIYNKRKPIETIFYLSFNHKTEKFEVLDGIHRLTALKLIKEENSKPLLDQHNFVLCNDADWLFNQYVLVNIRFNSEHGDLSNAFQNLNKSRPVPELYMGNHQAKTKVKIINNIANDWYHKYKKHFSGDNVINPNTGNTNRDKFVDLLDKLYDKHECKDENKLRDILDNANEQLLKDKLPKVSDKVLSKCKETGCYLFLLKNDKLLKYI